MKLLMYWVYFLFGLLVLALPTSMALMELSSWLMFLTVIVIFVIRLSKKSFVFRDLYIWYGTKFDKFLWLFIFSAVLTIFLNFDLNSGSKLAGFLELRWIFPFISFAFLFREFRLVHKPFFKWFMGAVILICIIYSFFQAFMGLDIFRSNPEDYGKAYVGGHFLWRSKGFFSNTLTFSYVYAMYFSFFVAAVLAWIEKKKMNRSGLLTLGVTLFFGIVLLLTQTRGMWIAVFFMLCALVIFVFKKRSLIIIPVFCGFLGGAIWNVPFLKEKVSSVFVFDESNKSNHHRINIWKANLQMFSENPVLGIGYRRNVDELQNYYKKMNIEDDFVGHAHNTYLQVLAGSGIVVFVFFLLFMGSLLVATYGMWISTKSIFYLGSIGAQIVFHVGGFTENVFMDGEIWYNFMFLASLTAAWAIGDAKLQKTRLVK